MDLAQADLPGDGEQQGREVRLSEGSPSRSTPTTIKSTIRADHEDRRAVPTACSSLNEVLRHIGHRKLHEKPEAAAKMEQQHAREGPQCRITVRMKLRRPICR